MTTPAAEVDGQPLDPGSAAPAPGQAVPIGELGALVVVRLGCGHERTVSRGLLTLDQHVAVPCPLCLTGSTS